MEIGLLSIIVPIYKQEKTIKEDLERIHNTLSITPYKFEIIGVVDGTTLDNSLSVAKTVNKTNIKIYGYENNRGKGQAVRYGMQKAKGDIVTFIDSGMDIDPNGIIMLLEHMKWYNADIIIGSKLHPASKVDNYTYKRKILTYGYYLIVKFLFGLKTRDIQTGVKAYKKEVLNKVLDKLVIKKFAFDVEILVVANALGYRKIYDAPVIVTWNKNNTSINGLLKKGIIRDFLIDTLAVWYRLHILKYYFSARKREKRYDDNLKMYINTGNMKDKRQFLIRQINKLKIR
jgi:glycosyltransferase involved in cell wall biosynthesis